jgi:hypothetical protein
MRLGGGLTVATAAFENSRKEIAKMLVALR